MKPASDIDSCKASEIDDLEKKQPVKAFKILLSEEERRDKTFFSVQNFINKSP